MKYRCPHCGKPGFSFVEKVDFLPPFLCAKCDCCKEMALCHARWGGHMVQRWIRFTLGLGLIGFYVWAATHLPKDILLSSDIDVFIVYFFVPLLVWAVLAGGFNWAFCYLEKPHQADYVSAPTFRFAISATARLWPRVRVGEIYLFRFPKRKEREDGPYLVGMVTEIKKEGVQKIVTVRVIKEYLMEAPLMEETVVLTTTTAFSVTGMISRTYRLPKEE